MNENQLLIQKMYIHSTITNTILNFGSNQRFHSLQKNKYIAKY